MIASSWLVIASAVSPPAVGGRGINERRKREGLPRFVDPKLGGRDIVPHGFRTTFRTWAAERTGFPREIAEMCLAHDVGSDVERAYQRSDLLEKRRRLMVA